MATILIVDDRPTNRELLVTLLGYAGHRPLEATNGEEGLSVARAEHPDLIITDIVMPKMDGYEFARQVRADAAIGQTQIIFYTSSYIVTETRRLAEACGVSLVIGKPIEPEIFLETIKTALDHKQPPVSVPVPEDFHREHMRLLTDTLVKKVEDLEVEISERKQAEEQVHTQAARLKILADASHTFSASVQDYQSALDQVVRLVAATLADMCQIRLLSDNKERLELAAIYSLDSELSETLLALENPVVDLENDNSLAAQMIRSGKPVLASSITLEQLWASNPPEYRPIFERFAPHSFILVPLRVEGRNIGGLGLTRYQSERPAFTEDDLSLAQDLADRAALAINSARLFQDVQNELAERQRAETQLAEAHEFLEKVVTSSPIGILTYKFTGECLSANEYGANIVGASVEQLLSQNFHELESWKRSGLYKLAQSAISTRQQQKEDIHILTTFGKKVWFTAQFVVFQSGAEDCLLLTMSDITERKQAEQAVQESEAHYRQIIETAHEGVWTIDAQGRTTLVNRRSADILGYSMKEIHGKSFFEFLDAAGQAQAAAAIANVEQGLHEQTEIKFQRKDGSLGWAIANTSPLMDQDGTYAGALAMWTDITERKRAEEALVESERQYRQIIETSQEGVWVIDADNRTTLANQRLADMLGYRIDEMIGKIVYDFTDEEGKAIGAKSLENRRLGIDEQLDFKYIRKDGSVLWTIIETSSLQDQDGNYIGALAMVTDITERKRADEALELAYSQLTNLYNNLPQALFSLDVVQNKMLQVSLAHEAIFGHSIEEFFKNPQLWYEMVIPEDKASVDASFPVLLAGKTLQQEYRILRPDGKTRWIEGIIKPTLVNGKAVRFDGIVSDITERKQAEEKIRKQLSRLTALSEIDRAISSNLDMRLSLTTVLVHVMAQLEVDAADVLLFNPAAQTLEYAAGQGFHTDAIENTLISISRGHAAHAVLNRRLLHIPDLRKQPDDSPRSALFESEGFVSYWAVPLFAKGELNGMLGVFHRSPLQHDAEWLDFLNTLAGQCAIAIDNASLFDGLQRTNAELSHAYEATIEGWSHALDLRDKETEGHTQRVTEMAMKLARAFKLSDKELAQVRRGALLHDIGKMGVPDGILLKPGPLTEEEWAVMKKHPVFAYELLSPIEYLHDALDIPYCHHEKWDGTGYPRGLKGTEIPLEARLFAVIDVWDALSSDRPYRAAWSKEKVREHIQSLAGTHFDPQVVKVFLESDIVTSRKRK